MNAVKTIQVLIVEDSAGDADLLLAELKRKEYAVQHRLVQTREDYLAALQERAWDAVVSDYVMPRFSGPEALELLRQQNAELPFIMVSGVRGEEEAVAMMRAGANDYVLKEKLSRLVPALERELAAADARRLHRRAVGAMQYLAAIVESSEDAIYGKNLDSIIVSWNPAAERLFGYSAEEIIGKSVLLLFPPDRRDEMLDILNSVRRGEITGIRDTERRHKNGQIIPVSITVSPIRDVKGEIIGASSIARDIRRQKRAEVEKQRLADRLAAAQKRRRIQEDEDEEGDPDTAHPPSLRRDEAGRAGPRFSGNAQYAGLCIQGWNVFQNMHQAHEFARQWIAQNAGESYKIYNAQRQLVATVVSGNAFENGQPVRQDGPKRWWKFWK